MSTWLNNARKENPGARFLEMQLFPKYTTSNILDVIEALMTGEFKRPENLKENAEIVELIRKFNVELLFERYYAATGKRISFKVDTGYQSRKPAQKAQVVQKLRQKQMQKKKNNSSRRY